MKNFFIDRGIPSLTEYEDVLITREESRIYREIDKILGQAMVETLELEEEVQGYEMVEVKERVTGTRRQEQEKHEHQMHSDATNEVKDYEKIEQLPAGSLTISKADDARPYAVTEGPASETTNNMPSGELIKVVDE